MSWYREMSEKKCACPSPDARECIDLRYRPRVGFVCDLDGLAQECECGCHDWDEWDDYEEDGPMDLEDQLDNALARS
jgi:hypothetical protein